MAPAGIPSAGYGGRSVEALRLPVLFVISRFSSHVSARHLYVAVTVCPARSLCHEHTPILPPARAVRARQRGRALGNTAPA
ncbi:hypothetical protein SMG44B_100049 [Stenotrophomonas maltophilia]|nr:hypothetical protein BN1263180035 [Stenotrophomonas maltophilia]